MKTKHTATIITYVTFAIAVIAAVPLSFSARADQVPETGTISVPGTLPGPNMHTGLPMQPLDINHVTEMVWGSILGTEKADPATRKVLEDVPVLMSGVREIKGKIYLYLGIGRDYHNIYGDKHIRAALQKRFPGIPFYVEGSDGVQLLTQTQEGEEKEIHTIFTDDFQQGLDNWTAQAFFATNPGWAAMPLDDENDNVAQTFNCPWICNIALKDAINIETYKAITISFDRWVDPELNDTENLRFLIGDNENYKQIAEWGSDDNPGAWQRETFTFTEDQLSDAFTIRFLARPSATYSTSHTKKMAIDNITITADVDDIEIAPHLTIQTTATPQTVTSGVRITVTATVQNTGNTPSDSQTITVYRHTSQTSTPTVGGAQVASGSTGTVQPDQSITRTAGTTAPTVSTQTTYHYYACIDTVCSGASVTVNPEAEEEEKAPDLTIQTTATPQTVTSGDRITVAATVQNTGNAPSDSQTITVYRHTSQTNTPTVGGTRIGSGTTRAIRPNAGATRRIRTTAPTVSTQTTYHYYACIDTTCSGASVTVNPEEPLVSNTITIMGGDELRSRPHAEDINYDIGIDDISGGSTITLGGLITVSGTKGLVISGHAAMIGWTPEAFARTDALVFSGGDTWDQNKKTSGFTHFLGKVMRRPQFSKRGKYDNFIHADATFVAYPSTRTASCSLTWTGDDTGKTFCLDLGHGEQIETVTPLAIRGKDGAVYTVTDSESPTMGLEIMFSGKVSGVVEGNRVVSDAILTLSSSKLFYAYNINGGGESISGDSGSPIYTVPDRNGNVQIVGILSGSVTIAGEKTTYFSSWDDVVKELDLRPIR